MGQQSTEESEKQSEVEYISEDIGYSSPPSAVFNDKGSNGYSETSDSASQPSTGSSLNPKK